MSEHDQDDYDNEVKMPIIEHLRELYRCIIRVLILIAVFSIAGFSYSEKVFLWLMSSIPEGVEMETHNLLSSFMIRLKLGIYTGVFFAAPFIAYQAYGFLRPALSKDEHHFSKSFLLAGWGLLVTAVLFTHSVMGYFIKSLLSWKFTGVTDVARIDEYIGTLTAIYLGFGLLFQIPLVIFLTIRQGLVTPEFYRSNRRWAIVIFLSLCAIFTPPDIISQIVVFVPIYSLFELALLAGSWMKRGDD